MMHRRIPFLSDWLTSTLGITFLLVGGMPLQGAPFDDLLAKIPEAANTLVLIDVDNTLATPLAKEQGWAKRLEKAYMERPVYLPPEAKKLVLAATLSPAQDFLPLWELAVMELTEPLSMRTTCHHPETSRAITSQAVNSFG
jgi:hypothetical protein